MAKKQVSWNVNTKVALVQADGAVVPEGSILAGTFDHEDPDEDHLSPDPKSHVLYHHIQEVMYHKGHYDMQTVIIKTE